MTDTGSLRLLRTSDVEKYRQLILDIHVEVRTQFGLMEDPFNAVERFDERLTSYASRDGWEVIIAYQADEPAGYIFGSPLVRGSLWWSSMRQPQPEEFTRETGSRTFAVQEVLVREAFRGTAGAGASRLLHETLLAERNEERATLLVDPTRSDGRLKAVYESWGYRDIGAQQPFDDSPIFATMLRDPLHQ
ncbi:N-acetyltransferase [Streptomyces ipomoeae]|uniref:N-acetyltransferase n=1 Tax=Streptomyces ipomoeae TaxID=103232 RepID=A0A540NUP8_9ACTN|nr:acetyltransferase [Streptomyces ipomoeae]MDX2694582.1 N-acetyltransferase [Streptomyces ipomoeae]MDX2825302.1 N-acetyltransferase [Streptomyces ipomoeae]MDX2841092.1 N-acetyltransferase [Streptomyces ipomoeae]MDX2935988.1 N-acetyltransferase [Streptomyces ipomoeae]TQE14752.1 N-acetyltransferase [Streptomyces ipomoeae]